MTPYDMWRTDAPDPPPAPEPAPLWHFLSDDWEHEHWIDNPAEVDEVLLAYAERGQPYTLRQLLVEPADI